MSGEADLDRAMREYRECCRHVWNTYFQPRTDGWHDFTEVQRALFEALVLTRVGRPRSEIVWAFDGGVSSIRVVPTIPPIGSLRVLISESSPPDGRWGETRLTSEPMDLRFAGFFDWRNEWDPMDLRFVRARVESAPRPEMVGRELLIEFEHAHFEAGV